MENSDFGNEAAEWAGDDDLFSDGEERKHLFSVLDSFRQYRRAAHLNVTHVRRQNFYALPTRQRSVLSSPPFSMLETFSRVDDAIATNAELAEAILETGLVSTGMAKIASPGAQYKPWHGTATKLDLDKARSTIHQMYRDWSAEGEVERAACYGPVMKYLLERFTSETMSSENSPRILVPGAGLGRLVYELCRVGFDVEGNEISYHQLLASSFILNHTTKAEEWSIHPFAFSFSNNISRDHQLMKVLVPDVHPGSLSTSGRMSMTTGDFSVLYRESEYHDTFDVVVTVFFIDTAPNLNNYIETVRHCLKPGGAWVNLGPLLWHFWDAKQGHDQDTHSSDEAISNTVQDLGISAPGGVELSEDEVIGLLEAYGFHVERHHIDSGATGYVQNPRSMLRNVYHPSLWIATKPDK